LCRVEASMSFCASSSIHCTTQVWVKRDGMDPRAAGSTGQGSVKPLFKNKLKTFD
jgi:hypothetical protein